MLQAQKIKEGDSHAFRLFYETCWQELFLQATYLLRSEELAKDFVQDAFVKLWRNREQIDPSQRLEAYLYTILKNNVINHIKREQVWASKQQEVVAKTDQPGLTPSDYLQAKELDNIIQERVRRMPEKMRDIWLMSRQQQLSIREIASKLAISPLTVKKQLSNALTVLRVELKEHSRD